MLKATGEFEFVLTASLGVTGLPLAAINPCQIRDFARAIGQRAKTDTLDARIIALFAKRIRALPLGRRHDPHGGQRLRQARHARVETAIKLTLKILEAQLAALDHDGDDTVRGSPVWRAADDLLTSVPGIGPPPARRLIVDYSSLVCWIDAVPRPW